jgi:hypothetical protein
MTYITQCVIEMEVQSDVTARIAAQHRSGPVSTREIDADLYLCVLLPCFP